MPVPRSDTAGAAAPVVPSPRFSEDHLARLYARVVREHGDRPAMRVLGERGFTWSYAEVGRRVEAVARALVSHGVQPGDRVAILAPNGPEWSVVDLGALAAGAVPVPIYPTSTADQVGYVLEHSGATAAFVGDADLLGRVTSTPAGADLRLLVAFDDATGAEPWTRVLRHGDDDGTDDHALAAEVARRTEGGRGEDLATIIYTSGTTGRPKGVALSHATMLHQLHAVDAFFDFGPDDSSLAFLPLSHALERAWTYFVLSHGALNTYVRDPKTVADQLREARPSALVAVPKLYETVYSVAHAMADKSPVRRRIFDWAFRVGRRVGELRLAGRPVPAHLRARLRVADRLVLHNVRDAIGGEKSVLAVGGAPLRPEVEEFFWAAGVLVCEGYGMTETGPLMTFNCPAAVRFGTVGRVILDGELRRGDEGELFYRGPNLMAGYWRDEEATREVLVDGWLRTGDVGEIDDDGFVRITDRLKDLIVTQQGKNIAPAPIEARIAEHPGVEHAVVIGDRRVCLVALVQPTADAGDDVLEDVRRHLETVNADLPHQEQVRGVELLDEPLTMDAGLLTPTLKVRRRAVEERFADQLDRMYDEIRRARSAGR